MEIIDCQLHEVHPAKPIEGLDAATEMAVNAELCREAIDSVGVDYALLNARLEFCQFAIDRYPEHFVGCPSLGPNTPDLKETLERYKAMPGILGIRTVIINWQDASLNQTYLSGDLEKLFAAAEEVDFPVCIFASGQAQELATIAKAHPNLNLILDHTGMPQPTPMEVREDPWWHLDTVNALAAFPNISVKFSAAQTLSKEPYPHHDAWPKLHTMIDAFSPDRLMWGADMTRLRMKPRTTDLGTRDEWAAYYSDSLNYLRDTDELSQSDKEKILGASLRRIFHWPKESRS